MITCTRKLAWDAMHRVPRHEGKCAAFHGHRYTAEVSCHASSLDDRAREVDYGVVKERVGAWIDENWDHTAILMRDDPDPAVAAIEAANRRHGRPVYWMPGPPTAENIAAELAQIASALLKDTGVTVVRVRIYETPNCWADWTA